MISQHAREGLSNANDAEESEIPEDAKRPDPR